MSKWRNSRLIVFPARIDLVGKSERATLLERVLGTLILKERTKSRAKEVSAPLGKARPTLRHQLLDVIMLQEFNVVVLTDHCHHVTSLEIRVGESEASLLLALLNREDCFRKGAESTAQALGFIAEMTRLPCHGERREKELFDKEKHLERISLIEEEVVFLSERSREFPLEKLNKLSLSKLVECVLKALSH